MTAVDPAVADASDEDDVVDADPAVPGAAGKKKRRKKKKAGAGNTAEADNEARAEDAKPAPAEPVAAEEDAAADSGDEDGEAQDGDGDAAGGGQKKKKKRKPKKKAGAAGKVDDESFGKWAETTLATMENGSERMSTEELMKMPSGFGGFSFTGPLRPAFVTPQLRMPDHIMKPDYATHPDGYSASERTGKLDIPILEGEPLRIMREACRLGREVLDVASRFMRAGVTGDQIDRIVFQACVDRNVYPSPLNYYKFPKSVCVSPNEVICHGIPDARPIEDGDIVNLDVTIYYQGFHADLNETFFIGNCDEDSHRLVRTAYNALHAAAKLIRPYTLYRDLGSDIHTEATKGNCAVVVTYCGHGIGELFHGPPKVPHYRKNKAVGIMKPGHVFTVEPMINLGTNGNDKTWPDNWTAVTQDGRRSAQFEHTFLVTETGCEVLTARLGTDRFSMPAYDPSMFQL